MIGDGVVARACDDRVGTTIAVDRIRPRARDDAVAGGRAKDGQTCRQDAGVEIFEIRDRNRVAACLVRPGRDGEINSRDAARRDEHERVAARSAVDGGFGAIVADSVVAGAGHDRICAAVAIDGIGARARRDDVVAGGALDRDTRRDGACVDILEAGDGYGIAGGLVRHRQVHIGRSQHDQGIGARAAIDRDFGTAIGNGVVACARDDRVGAAIAIDAIASCTASDDIRRGRAGQDVVAGRRSDHVRDTDQQIALGVAASA